MKRRLLTYEQLLEMANEIFEKSNDSYTQVLANFIAGIMKWEIKRLKKMKRLKK